MGLQVFTAIELNNWHLASLQINKYEVMVRSSLPSSVSCVAARKIVRRSIFGSVCDID